ncbi:hypothetical protein PIB30_065453 [Stylosanthes scabra]|uniref:C2H2-type domain-containing protein n=1 Tax=Stylosanthes scabra TaxID=79078 RepID=A0ABU6WM11_9FABA|nr:hypothetical protein [Stylosanthes scabra]
MFSSLWREKKEEYSRLMEMRLMLVPLCILLQLASVSSTAQATDQGYIDSNAGRTLQQEQDGNHQIHCSRERSRAAQKIIQEYLMPFVEKEKYHISRSCKLHPDNDLYRDQEQHKSHININEWQCGYCKKFFYEEKNLDQHFDNRHSDLLNLNQSQCLADLCGALHCDTEINSGLKKSKCNPAAAARNKHLCENSSCTNSVMHTAALEVGNLSPGGAGRRQVYSTSLHPFCF